MELEKLIPLEQEKIYIRIWNRRWILCNVPGTRVLRCAIVLRPVTLLHFHSVLRKLKYRVVFAQTQVPA